MHSRYILIIITVLGVLAAGCQHTSPQTAAPVDHTQWVEVARLATPWSVRKMGRVMQRERIPAWIDPAGYPSYPLKVPPEHRERATALLMEHGYEMFVSR
jgi:hypothetical protein